MRESASRVDAAEVDDDSCTVLRACTAITLLGLASSCQGNSEGAERESPIEAASVQGSPLLSRSRPLMSTVFRIQIDSPPDNAETVIRQAFQEIERLEKQPTPEARRQQLDFLDDDDS